MRNFGIGLSLGVGLVSLFAPPHCMSKLGAWCAVGALVVGYCLTAFGNAKGRDVND